MRPILIASAMALVLAAGGCRFSSTPENGATEASVAQGDWPQFVNSFIEASFKANPGFGVVQGRHEFDGQIADLSPQAINAEVDRLKKAIADAQAFADDKLTPEQRYQRDYLVGVAKGQLFWIDQTGADQLHHNPAAYLGFVDPSVYITVPYAPKEQRLQGLHQVPPERTARCRADACQRPGAHGDELRRLCQIGVRWLRRLLSWRRHGGMERCRHSRGSTGAKDRDRQCGEGDAGNGRLGGKPARGVEAKLRARQSEVPAHAR
jgi:hypothetical protein